MAFGLDYVTGPSIEAMISHDPRVTFVCRYLSEVNDLTKVKLLTPAEAQADSEARIAIVSNYEWTGTTPLGGFDAGIFDAKIGAAQHQTCGGPASRPIYFSVDFQPTSEQLPIVGDYFKGVASIIRLARTGAYGSYETIKYLFDHGLITWGWQTYAWSGGALPDERAHIQQYQNGVDFDGHSVDYNRSMKPDFGQWFCGGIMPVPQGWTDDGRKLTAPNGNDLVLGFREHVLNAPFWDPGDQPLQEEYHADQVLLHNTEVGAGERVATRDHFLWWTAKAGVIQEPYMGLELKACYDLIAQQQAEIAALKAQPPTIDTTALVAAINAIPDAIAQAAGTATAAAIVEAKKL